MWYDQNSLTAAGSFFAHGRTQSLPESASVVTDDNLMLFLADPLNAPYPPGTLHVVFFAHPTHTTPQLTHYCLIADWTIEERLCLFKLDLQVEEKYPANRAADTNQETSPPGRDPKTVAATTGFFPIGAEVDCADSKRGSEPYTTGGKSSIISSNLSLRVPPKVELVQSKLLPGEVL